VVVVEWTLSALLEILEDLVVEVRGAEIHGKMEEDGDFVATLQLTLAIPSYRLGYLESLLQGKTSEEKEEDLKVPVIPIPAPPVPSKHEELSPEAQKLLEFLKKEAGPDNTVKLRVNKFIRQERGIGVQKCLDALDELVLAGYLIPIPPADPQKKKGWSYKLNLPPAPKKGLFSRLFG
jgi:hypothetical protein